MSARRGAGGGGSGRAVSLAEVAEVARGELVGIDAAQAAELTVTDVALDDRSVRGGELFGCIPGQRADGHDFARAAIERGAVALLAERPLADIGAPTVLVSSVRAVVGAVAHRVHNSPSERLTLVGITGTSGKTTVAHLVSEMLCALGHRTSVAGTLSGNRTTAEAPDVCRWLAGVAAGGQAMGRVGGQQAGPVGGSALGPVGGSAPGPVAVMEVSSHGLEMGRVDGLRFGVAAFLNLGVDHLDYHGDVEHYFAAKAKLFDGRARTAVVNLDDPFGQRLVRDIEHSARQGVNDPPAIWGFRSADVSDVQVSRTGLAMRWARHSIATSVLGRHNVPNFAAAATIGRALGLDDADIAAGLCATTPVAGRMDAVRGARLRHRRGPEPLVLVDYAHKPDALRAVLTSSAELARASGGAVAVVVGAGGDRDVAKRSDMGAIAAELADAVTITTDNPRSEEPAAIARALRTAADKAVAGGARCVVNEVADRREAIFAAVAAAGVNDVVVVAGKGHEETQEFATHSTPFSDAEVCQEALAVWEAAG